MSNFVTPEQFAAANKTNIETLLTLANTAFASAERLAALNLNTARSLLEDGVANTKALLAAKDVQELVNLQASLAQPIVEKAVAYARSVYEIMVITGPLTQVKEQSTAAFFICLIPLVIIELIYLNQRDRARRLVSEYNKVRIKRTCAHVRSQC